jgi:hypothetical protein
MDDAAMLRPFVIAAMFALVAPSLTVAQENVPQNRGGIAPHPGGPPPGGAPRLAPVPRPPMGPPPGAGTFAPHPGGPPPGAGTFAPHPGGPPPGVVVGPPPGGFQNHPPGGPPPGAITGPPPGDPRHFGGPGGGGFAYHGRSAAQVHVAPFVYPQGYGYQRWAVGAVLPPFFLTPDYYYADWAALGLDTPQPGYEWVRYGPDLLLVDLGTGEVVDVAYDVFD